MQQDIKDKVFEIIAEQAVLNVSDINLDATLEGLGIDSLGLVEAMFAIEETFEIEVPFNANDTEAGMDLTSVGTMIAGVEKLIAQK